MELNLCVWHRTEDGGDTYNTTNVQFDPSILEFHPLLEETVLAYDEDHKELYVSNDFGETWMEIGMLFIS